MRLDGLFQRRKWVDAVARILFLLAITLAIISYGAVYPLPFNMVVFLVCLALAISLSVPDSNPKIWVIYKTCLLIVVLIGAYLTLQAISVPEFMADPIWRDAGEILDFDHGSISVEPATTIQSILPLALPFVIFMTALTLFPDDEMAMRLWRYLAGLGAFIALFAIVQFTFYPDSLLFREKEHYLESLTGTFVNRNSAATFFGLASLLVSGCLLRDWRSFLDRRRRLFGRWRPREFNNGKLDPRLYLFLWAFGLIITLLALFLTQSRAGIFATSLALGVGSALVINSQLFHRRSPMQRVVAITMSSVAIATVFIVFGGRTLLRLEEKGIEDDRWCAYRYTFDAIIDHPVLGSGFGTFQSMFPSYRIGACAPGGLWNMAHNSYLEAYLGLGLPFLAVLAVSVFALIWAMRTGFRERQRYRFVPAIGFAMITLVAAHSFVDFSLQIPGVAEYFAAAMAAITTISLDRARY